MRGQLLEATTNDTTPRGDGRDSAPPAVSRRARRGRVAAGWAAAAVVATLALWAVLRIPMDAPDANSPLMSNHLGVVDAENSVGQTFIATRDNLDRMSLLLSVEQPNDYSSITFTIRDGGPNDPVLRTVKQQISRLPVGDPFRYNIFHTAALDPRWQLLTFEPIPNSAGRKLFFSIEGKYIPPPTKVGVAMMFHSGYPEGTAYVNGGEQNAHVVFRAESRGDVRDYLGGLPENVTFEKQGPLANPATYAAPGVVYVLLLAALLRTAWRALRGRPAS